MKAERRQELKTNALARNVENAPAFFQKYGSRILLVIILGLLAYILVQRHYQDSAAKVQNASRAMGKALYDLHQLQTLSPVDMFKRRLVSSDELAASRRTLARDIETSIADALGNSDDARLRASALVARGDLNWCLANAPALPGAATRPDVLGPEKPRDDYLSAAAEAYTQVLSPPLNGDNERVNAARMSLGKIEEDRGNWDKASSFYQQVVDDPSTIASLKLLAKQSQEGLKTWQTPVYLGAASTPAPAVAFGPELPSTPLFPSPPPAPATGSASGPATTPSSGLFPPPSTVPSTEFLPVRRPTSLPTTRP